MYNGELLPRINIGMNLLRTYKHKQDEIEQNNIQECLAQGPYYIEK